MTSTFRFVRIARRKAGKPGERKGERWQFSGGDEISRKDGSEGGEVRQNAFHAKSISLRIIAARQTKPVGVTGVSTTTGYHESNSNFDGCVQMARYKIMPIEVNTTGRSIFGSLDISNIAHLDLPSNPADSQIL